MINTSHHPKLKLLFLFLIIGILQFSCSPKEAQKKITLTSKTEQTLDVSEFNYVAKETAPSLSSIDSLYEFYHEIRLDSQNLDFKSYNGFEWSDPAQVFVTKRTLSVFNDDLEEVFTDKGVFASKILCFKHKPFAISADKNIVQIIDLKKQKVSRQFKLKGENISIQHINNNEVLAITKKSSNSIYRYFFSHDKLFKHDSVEVKIDPRKSRPKYSPDLNYFLYKKGDDLIVEKVNDKSTRKINFETKYGINLLFSDDGKRIVLTGSKAVPQESHLNSLFVFSFPELEKIYEEVDRSHRPLGRSAKTKDNYLLFWDTESTLKIIDINTGALVFADRVKYRLKEIGIASSNRIIYAVYDGTYTHCYIRNFKTDKVLKYLKTSSNPIIPVITSSDSKIQYLYHNDQIHSFNFSTLEFKTITEHNFKNNYVSSFYWPTINSDNTKLAFYQPKHSDLLYEHLNQISVLDLTTNQLEVIQAKPRVITSFHFFFGAHPNELIVCTDDGLTKIYNLTTKEWSTATQSFRPYSNNSLTFKRRTSYSWPAVTQNNVSIFTSWIPGNRYKKQLTYFDTKTYEIIDTVSYYNNEVLGLDKHGNYYITDKEGNANCYEKGSMELINTIPGKFRRGFSNFYATTKLDVFHNFEDRSAQQPRNYTQKLFSPSEPQRYQYVQAEHISITPDLNYAVLTRKDKITILRLRK